MTMLTDCQLVIEFSSVSDTNPWTHSDLTTVGTLKVASNVLNIGNTPPPYTAAVYVTEQPDAPLIEAFSRVAFPSDMQGVILVDPSTGDGYALRGTGQLRLYPLIEWDIDTGDPLTFGSDTLSNNDEYGITYDGETLTAYKNDVSLFTFPVSGDLHPGWLYNVDNVSAGGSMALGFTWSDSESPAITYLGDDDTTVRVGETCDVETSGLGDLTTASTIGGKAIASADAPDGSGTITLAGFTAGQTYPAMGTVTCIMTDDSLSASANRVLDTMPGWQWVTVAGLDRGEWSLGKAFAEDEIPSQLHVIDDGTGVLNPDGTLTDWPTSGTFTCWARMAAGGGFSEGEMTSFNFTVSSGGSSGGVRYINWRKISYEIIRSKHITAQAFVASGQSLMKLFANGMAMADGKQKANGIFNPA